MQKMGCFQVDVHESHNKRGFRLWRKSFTSDSTDVSRESTADVSRESTADVSSVERPSHSDPNLNSSISREGSAELSQCGSKRPQVQQELRAFTFSELKAATRNFYKGNLLGEGGFGCVYSGVIKQNGDVKTEVAVKQLNQKGLQGEKEWLAEVNYLGKVEHPNLVKLIGYCAEEDNRGVEQRLLVYEFMPNKTLDDHLFNKQYRTLPWQTRIRIALGTARGLCYLHEEMEFQVIYRDFKASNVLLDDKFNPKLSDFGLARQGPSIGNSHVSTAIVGTIGYAAPEYLQTGHLTAKSDVWSFGIVLLELLTGKRAVDKNRPRAEQRLIDWVRPFLKDGKKFSQLMDSRLEGEYPVKAAHRLASLASQCLQKARARPKMSEVVESLQKILEISESPLSPTSVMGSPLDVDRHRMSSIPSLRHDRGWSLRAAIFSMFSFRKTI